MMASKESFNLIDLAKDIKKITEKISPNKDGDLGKQNKKSTEKFSPNNDVDLPNEIKKFTVLSPNNDVKEGDAGEASRRESEKLLKFLKSDLYQLQRRMIGIEEYHNYIGEEMTKHIRSLRKVLQKVEAGSSRNKVTKGMKKDLDDINIRIVNLRSEFPLLPIRPRKPRGSDSEESMVNNGKQIVRLPGIHSDKEGLKRLAVFKDVQESFKNTEWKLCLLSFAVFPENQEVNRTMLMHWWIGEGILPEKVKPEVAMKNILKEFTDKNLIEPVENKRKVEPSSYKMSPAVHSSVVLLSKELTLFDIDQHEKRPTVKQSELNKVCLVKWSSNQTEAKTMQNVHQIETVFNVAERFPEFTFKWFWEDLPFQKKRRLGRLSKTSYRALKVFYLGRWERTPKRHIEVQNPALMKILKHMTKLRLLSFQGITGIVILDDAVCKLHDLIVLDLRACYYLEKLPDKIESLKKLIYLDITDCYMIDCMPKSLSWLGNLEVFKGFVVSDADEETVCTLVELKHLKKLRKLSITVKTRNFSVLQLFLAIMAFINLENLKVLWEALSECPRDKNTATADTNERAGGFFKRKRTMILCEKEKDSRKAELPKTLKKLDLQCFPDPNLPEWLEPEKLLYLEKLYIKGGMELARFGKVPPEQPTKCSVKVLRLKFLPRLKVEWRDLSISYFPKLNFLEKYQCPQVSFCPTDGMGIWCKKHEV